MAEPPERLTLAGGEELAVRIDLPAGQGPRHGPGPDPARPPILYFHGFASSAFGDKGTFFRRRALAAGHPFAAFDFRGHGASGGCLEDLTLSRNLEDAAAVHELLDRRLDEAWGADWGRPSGGEPRPAILLGSSMGGLTASWHAALVPERSAAVLAIAPAYDLHRSFLDAAGEATAARWRADGRLSFDHETGPVTLSWALIEDLEERSLERLLPRVRTPTLVLQGRGDASVPWRRAAAPVIGGAAEAFELHLFADGDHRLADRLERLWRLMEEFLVGRGLVS